MKKIILTLTIGWMGLTAFSQSKSSVSGQINSAEGAKGLSSATVTLLNKKDSSLAKAGVADAAGRYFFENVKAGTYFLSATAVGYQKINSAPFTLNNENLNREISPLALQIAEKSLSIVTVTARKPFIERKADRTIINVDGALTNAGNTAMEVLEKSPGVSVDKDGNISLKGKQGVLVTIDGKQTYMGSQALAVYLQSMPASQLELIELMPNPSSKYDAAGNSGIINIKTKKNRQKGFNGSINNTYSQGRYARTSNSLNLNYRNGKFNVFSSVGVSHRKQLQVLDIHREYKDNADNLTAVFDQQARFLKTRNNDNAKLGVDYYASKKTTIGLLFTGYVTPNLQTGTNTSFLKDGASNVNSILTSLSRDKENWKNAGFNFNVSHNIDSAGTTITADADVLKYKSIHAQKFNSNNFTPNWVKQSSEDLVSELPAAINVYSAKTDFVHPFKGGLKLEAGLKTSLVKTDNFAGYFNVINGISSVDNDKTNHFKYNENINAAYVNFSKDIKKWSLQAGLRMENTNYKGNQFGNPVNPDSSFKKSYTGLFPTLFTGYKLNGKNEFGFSYGKRISRPDYEDLNPFIFFIDKYTYEAGNPFLKPMYTNVFELSHTYNKFLTTTVNYTHSRDMFNEFFRQLGYATIVSHDNYGSVDDISVSMNAELKPTKWWTLMPYGEFNYNAVNSKMNGADLKTRGAGFNFNMNNQFKFKKGWAAELSGFYRTGMKSGQFEIQSMKQLSTGVSKQILKGKGSVKLNVSDVFDTNEQHGVIKFANTAASFTQKNDTKFVSLNMSYRFGKPMKTKQRKTGGAGDEQNRIKGN